MFGNSIGTAAAPVYAAIFFGLFFAATAAVGSYYTNAAAGGAGIPGPMSVLAGNPLGGSHGTSLSAALYLVDQFFPLAWACHLLIAGIFVTFTADAAIGAGVVVISALFA